MYLGKFIYLWGPVCVVGIGFLVILGNGLLLKGAKIDIKTKTNACQIVFPLLELPGYHPI